MIQASEIPFDAQNLSWLGSLLGLYSAAQLEPKELVNRLPSIRLFAYPEKTEIIKEGERGEDFYILYKGNALVFREGKQIAQLLPGDFFGEVGFLVSVNRTATVCAGQDCQAFRIHVSGFEEFVNQYPALLGVVRRAAKRRLSKIVE